MINIVVITIIMKAIVIGMRMINNYNNNKFKFNTNDNWDHNDSKNKMDNFYSYENKDNNDNNYKVKFNSNGNSDNNTIIKKIILMMIITDITLIISIMLLLIITIVTITIITIIKGQTNSEIET